MSTRILGLGLLTAICGQVGYYSGRYVGGSGIYTIDNNKFGSLLRDDAPLSIGIQCFPQSDSVAMATEPHEVIDGTVVSHVLLGQRAIGFPFMAHGGLLASLTMMRQFSQAQSGLVIKYLHATIVGKILCIEAINKNHELNMHVYYNNDKKPLFKAHATGAYELREHD